MEDLEAQGFLVKVETLKTTSANVNVVPPWSPCYRLQWFVKIQSLADPAIDAVESGRTGCSAIGRRPISVDEEYSRLVHLPAIVVGTSIPAWYAPGQEIIVARVDPVQCSKCGSSSCQDQDVLDTWFSSGYGRSRQWDGPIRRPI
jgi:valyl-tRNA synthetase